jgi:predicted GIY-YIG superfamily endonuclease
VYSEPHASPLDARVRERQIKHWTRRKKEALIAGNLVLLKSL